MNTMDCNSCREALPELLAGEPGLGSAVSVHLSSCAPCRAEYDEMRAVWVLMDEWVAPEPSAYFDTRLHARLRQEQTAAPEGLWERLSTFLHLSTGRGLRPAMAGALGLAMLLGGGTAVTLLTHHGAVAPAVSSPTVNDLRIYDNNAQAVQQMDLLDDAGATPQT